MSLACTYKSRQLVVSSSLLIVATTAKMDPKFFYTIVVCLLVLDGVSSNDVADVYPSRWGSDVSSSSQRESSLQQAIKYLVNYTASEAKASLDMYSIGSTVAAIAYQELTDKFGMCIHSYLASIIAKH